MHALIIEKDPGNVTLPSGGWGLPAVEFPALLAVELGKKLEILG